MRIKTKSHQLKQYLKPLQKKLIKVNKDAAFYTGIPKLTIFSMLAKYTQQLVKRKQQKSVTLSIVLKYRKTPPASKRLINLCMEDRILLVLMKLRLGLLNKDLADR